MINPLVSRHFIILISALKTLTNPLKFIRVFRHNLKSLLILIEYHKILMHFLKSKLNKPGFLKFRKIF